MAAALRMRVADVPVYVAGWDTKPPLVFLFHRLALAVAPGAPLLAAHLFTAALASAACVLVALSARRLAGDAAGLFAALGFALLDSTGTVAALASNTEVLTYLPCAALTFVLADGRFAGARLPFVAGALAAVAALAKLPTALYAPAALAAILLVRGGRGWLGAATAGLAGVAAVLVPAFAALALSGAWDDFLICNVELSGHRALFAADLARDANYARWANVARANAVLVVGVLLTAFGALRARSETDGCRSAVRIAGPLALAGLGAALAGGAGYQHYLQMAYVPVAVLGGVGLARLTAGRWPAFVTGAVCVAAVACALPDRGVQWRSRNWKRYDHGPVQELLPRVQALVPEDGTLFVWGMHADLHVTCLRAPASRLVTSNWLVGTYTGRPSAAHPEPFELAAGAWDLLFRDLEASAPALVVDSVPAGVHGFDAYPVARFPRLDAWLRARYVPESGPGGYVLWVRK
jgi:hypothetical protein